MAWISGLYTKMAIQSSVMVCGLADKSAINKMPSYPEMPTNNHEEERELAEEEIKVQTQYFIAKMEYWTKKNNKKK